MSKPRTSSTPPAFTTIDPSALDAVTGGATKKASQDQILDKLIEITGVVADVANARQQQPNNGSSSMTMMMMMMFMKKQNGAV